MSSQLTAERVRRDIDVLAHAGLDVVTFLGELDASLRRAVPYSAACVASMDPATMLLTGTYKFGALAGIEAHDHEWGLIEYGEPEETAFLELARTGAVAASVAQSTGGDVMQSARLRDFMDPHFGFTDEARIVARSGDRVWGGIALFRGPGDEPFSPAELEYLGSLSAAYASGMRAGLLARLADAPPPLTADGPAVVIVGADESVKQTSVGAAARLEEIVNAHDVNAPKGIIAALVAQARQFAAGRLDTLPRCRVRLRTGRWYVLHASPLAGSAESQGDVVITIEEARPPEIIPIVVAAFDLTPRERDVTQLVLQGVDTKQIASQLHLSAYTVQDHLKSVFEKADVRSRRELVARVYFDQYVPRLGADVGNDGWFAT